MDDRAGKDLLAEFVLSLNKEPNFSESAIQEVIENFENFIKNDFNRLLKKDIINTLNDHGHGTPEVVAKINAAFNDGDRFLDNINTQHKRLELLKRNGYLNYKEFAIGKTYKPKKDDETKLVTHLVQRTHLPLKNTLKNCLEKPGFYDSILNYMRTLNCESNYVENLTQANYWTKRYLEKDANKFVLPLILFYKEVEVKTRIGDKFGRKKFFGIYAYIPCLPRHVSCQITSNIFSLLLYPDDIKNYDIKTIFKPIIDDINFLQEKGIRVNLNGLSKQIYFHLVNISGNYLELNSVLGLRSSNEDYCCLICRASCEQMKTLVREDGSLLRTKDNYKNDLREFKGIKNGITEPCTFHDIKGFHIAENINLDIENHIVKNIGVSILKILVNEYVYEKKYFTIEFLNSRINAFNFNTIEDKIEPFAAPEFFYNKVKKILDLQIQNFQILYLIRYFGLIIGDLIPESDKCWLLFKYFRNVLDIILSPRHNPFLIEKLSVIIEELNLLYIELFKALKPEFHLLVHVPRLLSEFGPCSRFRDKNLKSCHEEIQTVSCNKNILKTVVTKEMMKTYHIIHTLDCQQIFIKFGEEDEEPFDIVNSYFPKEIKSSIKYFLNIQIMDMSYNLGIFIIIKMNENSIKFGKILKIAKAQDDIHFYLQVFEENNNFNEHLHAYVVNNNQDCKIIRYHELPLTAPCLSFSQDDKHYIIPQYYL